MSSIRRPAAAAPEKRSASRSRRHLDPRRGGRSKVLGRPSSSLGSTAAAAMVGSIGLLFGFTAMVAQGPEELDLWQRIAFVAILLCLLGSWALGLVAVIRRHERSWLVLLPTAVLSLAVLNELLQGLLQLAGLGDG